MSRLRPFLLAAAVLGVAASAPAQSNQVIASAKQAGTVGERYDGYLGMVSAVPEPVRRQVGEVNIIRRRLYTGLATRRNATVQEVGVAAGCELLERVRVGESYMLNDNVWRRRAAGQPAQVPGYCR